MSNRIICAPRRTIPQRHAVRVNTFYHTTHTTHKIIQQSHIQRYPFTLDSRQFPRKRTKRTCNVLDSIISHLQNRHTLTQSFIECEAYKIGRFFFSPTFLLFPPLSIYLRISLFQHIVVAELNVCAVYSIELCVEYTYMHTIRILKIKTRWCSSQCVLTMWMLNVSTTACQSGISNIHICTKSDQWTLNMCVVYVCVVYRVYIFTFDLFHRHQFHACIQSLYKNMNNFVSFVSTYTLTHKHAHIFYHRVNGNMENVMKHPCILDSTPLFRHACWLNNFPFISGENAKFESFTNSPHHFVSPPCWKVEICNSELKTS